MSYLHSPTADPKATGFQLAQDLFAVPGINNHLLAASVTLGTGAAGAALNNWSDNPFNMNPNQLQSGGSIVNAETAASQFKTDRVRLISISGEHDVMNAESCVTDFKIYYFTCKRNTNIASATTFPNVTGPVGSWWSSCLTDLQAELKAPYTRQQRVITNVTNTSPSTGAPTTTTYGETPFMHPTFKDMFKLHHVEAHQLQPGSTKKIKFHFHYNTTFDKQTLLFLQTNGSEWLSNKTVFAFVVARAAPVVIDNTGGIRTAAPGPVQLAHTINYKATFSYPVMEKRRYMALADFNYPSNNVLAQQKQVDDTDQVDFMQQD